MARMLDRPAPARLLAAGALLMAFLVAGCGGKDTSPVCSDVTSLKSSVSSLGDVKLEQGALSTLQTRLATVQQDFAQLKSSAKDQFSSEISAVDSAYSSFKTSLDAAVKQPSTATIAAAGATLQPLVTALKNLESAVQKTC